MKKLLFIFSLFFSFPLFAQNYFPFPDANAVWTDLESSQNGKKNYKYGIGGDTIINSKTYKKIYESTEPVFNVQNATYYASLREENKKWYVFPPYGTTELLFYDFDIATGDTVAINGDWYMGPFEIYVNSIDSILISGQYRKRIRFNESFGYYQATWIEGIGSIHGLFRPGGSSACVYYDLICFEENDTIKYLNPDWNTCYYVGIEESVDEPKVRIFPNPTKGKFRVESLELGVETIEVYDLFGRLVLRSNKAEIDMSSYPAGIYIWQVGEARGKLIKE